MSTFAYAGTTQLIAINLMDANVSLLSLFSAIAIIDLRHVFYSISVASRFPVSWRKKWYLTSQPARCDQYNRERNCDPVACEIEHINL